MNYPRFIGLAASALLQITHLHVPPANAETMAEATQISGKPAFTATPHGMLATLPVPQGYANVEQGLVEVDGESALLIRLERADKRNGGLGGEHFSAVVAPSGKLKGFVRMDLALRGGALPSQDEAHDIAMRFLSDHAADLLPRHAVSFIAPHDEAIRADGESTALTGMKVKMRNLADGRWFWVIVGSDREVMVFERDIVWANLKGRRQTEKWLHDSWLAEQRKARGA
ncbi:hypothetical protein J1C56_01510 [Aminobacter anthyllidis]|uniref:Uncharacterized protein n=1 Tax=Aminobacter anthyllidis TaxID=1035067 RepID=A0A9X1D1Q6_9HYPH|nr:hypothetical protein [Aminobacter anthyllidis]MBT1154262.1 hypothetical protein [Aminobacter anthyllidis]